MSDVLLPIVAEISIAAPIGQVWDTLTAEAAVPGWLGCMGYRPEAGATFYMQSDPGKRAAGDSSGATHCRVETLQPPHKFNFAWFVPGTPETLVQISVFSEGTENSFVRLVHDGWERFPADPLRGVHEQLAAGWRHAALPGLKRAAESKG